MPPKSSTQQRFSQSQLLSITKNLNKIQSSNASRANNQLLMPFSNNTCSVNIKSSFQEYNNYLQEQLHDDHETVINYVEQIDHKMQQVVQFQKEQVFNSYWMHMFKVQQKLDQIIKQGKNKRRQALNDPSIMNITNQRDWFRKQALSLKQHVDQQTRIKSKLLNISSSLKDDKEYLLRLLLKEKQNNIRLYSKLKQYTNFPEIILKKIEIQAQLGEQNTSSLPALSYFKQKVGAVQESMYIDDDRLKLKQEDSKFDETVQKTDQQETTEKSPKINLVNQNQEEDNDYRKQIESKQQIHDNTSPFNVIVEQLSQSSVVKKSSFLITQADISNHISNKTKSKRETTSITQTQSSPLKDTNLLYSSNNRQDQLKFKPFFKTELDPIFSPLAAVNFQKKTPFRSKAPDERAIFSSSSSQSDIQDNKAVKAFPIMSQKDNERIKLINLQMNALLEERKQLDIQTNNLQKLIIQYKTNIKEQTANNKDITRQRVLKFMQESELQEFFLSCLTQIKKELIKSKNMPKFRATESTFGKKSGKSPLLS